MKCPKQPIAAGVSCKRSTCAIPAVGCRRKPQYQDFRIGVTKGRHGLTPIIFLTVPGNLDVSYMFPVGYQPGAVATTDDAVAELGEGVNAIQLAGPVQKGWKSNDRKQG